MSRPIFVRLGEVTLNLAAITRVEWFDRSAIVSFATGGVSLDHHQTEALRRLLAEDPIGLDAAFRVVRPCVPPIPTPDPEEWDANDRIGLGPSAEELAGAALDAHRLGELSRKDVARIVEG